MKKNVKLGLVALATLLSTATVKAQVEPHFSQYYAYPLWLNPALTGAFDGDYRVTAIHRRQWAGIMNPFSTYGLSADVVTNKNLNLGINMMNQSAGNAGYNYMNGHVSIAYTGIRFGTDGNQQLISSMQIGMINRKFDPTKFQYGDQWTAATGFDPSNAGAEALRQKSSTALDFGAGFAYYDNAADKKVNVFAGVAAGHITRPEDPFLTGSSAGRIPVLYTIHGGVRIAVNENLSILPNIIYMQQGTAREIMAGGFAQVHAGENVDVLGGINYRHQDAISPYAGFTYKNMTVGLSYDVNTTSLGKTANGNANSFELSLTYIGKKIKNDARKYFSCPRL